MIENDKKENEGLKKRTAEKEEKERATAANPVEEKDESSEEPPPRQIKKLRVEGGEDTRASGNIFDGKGRIIRTLD